MVSPDVCVRKSSIFLLFLYQVGSEEEEDPHYTFITTTNTDESPHKHAHAKPQSKLRSAHSTVNTSWIL